MPAGGVKESNDAPAGRVENVQERAVSDEMALMFPPDEAEPAERNRKPNEGAIDL